MQFSVIDIFTLIIISFQVLFAVFLLSAKGTRPISNRLLASFMLIDIFDAGGRFYSGLYESWPSIALLANSLVFTKLPLLYLYVLSVIYSDFKLKWQHALHLITFIIVLAGFLPEFFCVPYEQKLHLLESGKFKNLLARDISYIIIHLQIFVYFTFIFYRIAHYKVLLKENYSDFKALSYRWLFQIALLFAIVAVIATIKNFFMFFSSSALFTYAQFITVFMALIAISIIVIRAIHSSELFVGVNHSLLTAKELWLNEVQESGSAEISLSKKDHEQINDLIAIIENQKPFLNPSLTLFGLAHQLKMSSRDLSILINQKLNQHFFDFINSYRIKYAIELLSDSSKNLTIQEILFESGFNSKSSFNSAFKKFTNMTPTDYKKYQIATKKNASRPI